MSSIAFRLGPPIDGFSCWNSKGKFPPETQTVPHTLTISEGVIPLSTLQTFQKHPEMSVSEPESSVTGDVDLSSADDVRCTDVAVDWPQDI